MTETWAPKSDVGHDDHPVVFVHGLWMHGVVFALMRRRFRAKRFDSRSFTYPTVRRGLDANADSLAEYLVDTCPQPPHLLAHSLGGLVVLRMMARHPSLALARVVLMGSPVQGSHAARVLCGFAPTAALIGRSLGDWMQAPPFDGPLSAEVGVIAGNRGYGTGMLIRGIARPHDGIVSLAETTLPGARDRVTLRVSHSEMLISTACADAAARFLRNGRFAPDLTRAPR